MENREKFRLELARLSVMLGSILFVAVVCLIIGGALWAGQMIAAKFEAVAGTIEAAGSVN